MLKTFCLFAFLLLSISVAAQTGVTITPKKVTYTRKSSKADDFKRTFEIRYPVVSGTIKPAVKRALETTISYWRVFDTTLKESMASTWLDSADYKVNYNRNDILDIMLRQEGSAAYPDSQTVNLVIDLKTGRAVKFADVFKINAFGKLALMVDKKLQAEKREIIKQIDSDTEVSADEKALFKDQVSELNFAADSFKEFSVSGKGVTIFYDAGFPHAIQTLQPNGRYFFDYAELKPFLEPGGLLQKFIR